MKKTRIFIYCRVSCNELRYLLNYQEEVLSELAYSLGIDVVAVAKEISNGENFHTRGIQSLIHYITSRKVEIVGVYEQTRLCIHDDLYAEFQMICSLYNVKIVTINDLRERNSNHLL